MRLAVPLLLLLAAATGARGQHTSHSARLNRSETSDSNTQQVGNDTINEVIATLLANDTIFSNDTVSESGDEHEPVIRKKRTFGDIVFRGLADALGYNVARKPPQAAFPPPLPPVPGIDAPLQVSLIAAPAPAPVAAVQVAVSPCGASIVTAAQPCRAQLLPPPPPRPPPCPKPRAVQLPRPPPPQPQQLPCGQALAAVACAPPAPKQDPADTISSNLQLSFNFNRNRPSAPAEQQDEQPVQQVPIEPRAARLPAQQPRTPRVYVDAFVVRDGVTQRVKTVDANQLPPRQAAASDEDYIAYDDDEEGPPPPDDDYEDVQESRARSVQQRDGAPQPRAKGRAVREFGTAVDQFRQKKRGKKRLPDNHYQNVHFGDRDLSERLQRREEAPPRRNRLPAPEPDEYEALTSTEDPRRPLRPRVLPPTELNPGQIDTVTVRVPPIYKEKRPKKLHHQPDRDEYSSRELDYGERDFDLEGKHGALNEFGERPRRKRRRKLNRQTRSAGKKSRSSKPNEEISSDPEEDPFAAVDYDYFGKKLPISEEEKYFRQLRIPEPTKDADLARIEEGPNGNGDFLDDHERLREDPERVEESERLDDKGRSDDSGRSDESGRTDDRERLRDESERLVEDPERTDERQRADSSERSDRLSPSARVHETGFRNNYVHATNVRVDDPQSAGPPRRKKKKTRATRRP